ncbi:MAG: hypothetical protein KAT43_02100 [Nanoarchaeota archaeon]|nr:hypothetical protein [Nanoarchaeota archaeon]
MRSYLKVGLAALALHFAIGCHAVEPNPYRPAYLMPKYASYSHIRRNLIVKPAYKWDELEKTAAEENDDSIDWLVEQIDRMLNFPVAKATGYDKSKLEIKNPYDNDPYIKFRRDSSDTWKGYSISNWNLFAVEALKKLVKIYASDTAKKIMEKR